VLELKDRIRASGLAAARSSQPPIAAAADQVLLSALVNLGYRLAAAERTAETVRRNLGATAPLEDQLREALRLIAGAP
jgi:Holliday junction resolvasome RuvABC DNA-binding subunit